MSAKPRAQMAHPLIRGRVALGTEANHGSCEAAPGSIHVLVDNHTYCALDTIDAAQVSTEGFGAAPLPLSSIDAHSAVNARDVKESSAKQISAATARALLTSNQQAFGRVRPFPLAG